MRLGVLLVLAAAMSGCSWLVYDRDNDYLKSEIQPVIVIPEEVAAVSLTQQLPIPAAGKQQKPLPEEFQVPRPAALVIEDEPKEDATSLAQLSQVKLESTLLKDGNGTPILRLNVEFARAWSELGEALKKADFNITDLNRSIGTYYIEISQPGKTEEVGFWAGLFGAEPEAVIQQLQVKLNQARSGVYIAIHEDANNLASDEQAQSILVRIQEQL
ncbi:hypothetical protein NBRC116188_20620 [Oceaniserpentilla sp. 4NH20-0058]|uniref:outer membrane protein assembly factor BamC n=1 Tax=Oceaniserpentilla sp. 4NH20-0058 TaxID=3127660 RepID=UPI00310AE288